MGGFSGKIYRKPNINAINDDSCASVKIQVPQPLSLYLHAISLRCREKGRCCGTFDLVSRTREGHFAISSCFVAWFFSVGQEQSPVRHGRVPAALVDILPALPFFKCQALAFGPPTYPAG